MTAFRSASLGLVVAILAAVAAACSDRLPARFPHALHLSGVACGGPGLPDCPSCNGCHRVAHDEGQAFPDRQLCRRCHRSGDERQLAVRPPASRPAPVAHGIRFDHARHLALAEVKGQCVPCHPGAAEPDAPVFPPMARCFECHEHRQQWDRAECGPCHARRDLERLLPETFVRHDAAFQRGHGQAATQQKKLCQQCHVQAQCDDCHDATQDLSVEKRRPEAIERHLVHRGDFLSRHAIEVRSQPARCARCHQPSFCDGCHLERGVSGGRLDGRNPHPAGWIGAAPGAPSGHGRDARRDILTCAGCHEQGPATNCIRCHKVGGHGGNPHPKGWRSARAESAAMCRYCHVQ